MSVQPSNSTSLCYYPIQNSDQKLGPLTALWQKNNKDKRFTIKSFANLCLALSRVPKEIFSKHYPNLSDEQTEQDCSFLGTRNISFWFDKNIVFTEKNLTISLPNDALFPASIAGNSILSNSKKDQIYFYNPDLTKTFSSLMGEKGKLISESEAITLTVTEENKVQLFRWDIFTFPVKIKDNLILDIAKDFGYEPESFKRKKLGFYFADNCNWLGVMIGQFSEIVFYDLEQGCSVGGILSLSGLTSFKCTTQGFLWNKSDRCGFIPFKNGYDKWEYQSETIRLNESNENWLIITEKVRPDSRYTILDIKTGTPKFSIPIQAKYTRVKLINNFLISISDINCDIWDISSKQFHCLSNHLYGVSFFGDVRIEENNLDVIFYRKPSKSLHLYQFTLVEPQVLKFPDQVHIANSINLGKFGIELELFREIFDFANYDLNKAFYVNREFRSLSKNLALKELQFYLQIPFKNLVINEHNKYFSHWEGWDKICLTPPILFGMGQVFLPGSIVNEPFFIEHNKIARTVATEWTKLAYGKKYAFFSCSHFNVNKIGVLSLDSTSPPQYIEISENYADCIKSAICLPSGDDGCYVVTENGKVTEWKIGPNSITNVSTYQIPLRVAQTVKNAHKINNSLFVVLSYNNETYLRVYDLKTNDISVYDLKEINSFDLENCYFIDNILLFPMSKDAGDLLEVVAYKIEQKSLTKLWHKSIASKETKGDDSISLIGHDENYLLFKGKVTGSSAPLIIVDTQTGESLFTIEYNYHEYDKSVFVANDLLLAQDPDDWKKYNIFHLPTKQFVSSVDLQKHFLFDMQIIQPVENKFYLTFLLMENLGNVLSTFKTASIELTDTKAATAFPIPKQNLSKHPNILFADVEAKK